MVTLVANEVEAAGLSPLENEEPPPVPLALILLHKEVGKRLLTSPLDRDPFQLGLLAHRTGTTSSGVAHRNLAVYIVLDLLDSRVGVVNSLFLLTLNLEPVRHFEDVALF